MQSTDIVTSSAPGVWQADAAPEVLLNALDGRQRRTHLLVQLHVHVTVSVAACMMKDDADSVRGYGVYLRQLGIPSEFGEAIACRSQVASGAAGQKPNLSRDPGHVFWPCVPFDVLTCDTTSC